MKSRRFSMRGMARSSASTPSPMGPVKILPMADHGQGQRGQGRVVEQASPISVEPVERPPHGWVVGRLPALDPRQDEIEVDPGHELEVGQPLGARHDRLQVGHLLGRGSEGHAGLRPQDGQLDAPPGRLVADIGGLVREQTTGALEGLEGFVQGRPGERIAALRDEVLDRLLGIAGLLEVHGQDAGQLAASLGIQRLQRLSDEPVQLTALLLEERPVGGVLDEPVSEEVLELRSVGGDRMRPFASSVSRSVVIAAPLI